MNKLLLLLLLSGLLLSCKKNKPQLSANKEITTFLFTAALNPGLSGDAFGLVKDDSVLISVPSTVSLSSLKPSITYDGSSISPASGEAQNFTTPVVYSVTADDKSVRHYVVQVRVLSAEKSITSFMFRASDNPGVLSADAAGVISNDSILVTLNATNITNLTPAVTYKGQYIMPQPGKAADFTNPVSYSVWAEDGTSKRYTVVVRTTSVLFIGGQDGYLYAFDAITGAVRWKTFLGFAITTCPTYAAGIVYLTGSTYLYAFDATTGALKWKTNLVGDATTNPQVVNNTVYTVAINNTYNSGTITATDAATGAIRWQKSVYQNKGSCSPTVGNGVTVVGDGEAFLTGYDANTGQKIWSITLGIVERNPAVVNGVLYATTEFIRMMAIDIATGSVKWVSQYNAVQKACTAPTIANGTIYTSSDSLYAYDAATGALKWQTAVTTYGIGNLALENNFIYSNAAQSDGLYAFNSDGTVKWRYGSTFAYQQVFIAPPALTVANKRLYTGSTINNKLVALDAANGALLWSYGSTASFISGACVVDGNGNVFHSSLSGAQQ